MLFPAAATSSEVPLSSECTSPLGSSQVVGLYQHSWVQTGNSVTGQEPSWAAFLGFLPCWVSTGSLTHSGQISMVQEQDDRSAGLSSTWARKLSHLRQPYTGFLQVSMQAGYNCMQSQPGTSAMEMQSCLLGLASGQIRLGLTVCNVGNETRRQGDFAFAKNIIIT